MCAFILQFITPRPEGYGSRFVILSTALQRAALTSSRQLRYEHAKHGFILLSRCPTFRQYTVKMLHLLADHVTLCVCVCVYNHIVLSRCPTFRQYTVKMLHLLADHVTLCVHVCVCVQSYRAVKV